MVSVLGSASGVFGVSARQFQTKAQDIWQGLQRTEAAGASTPSTSIRDFIDPSARASLDALKKDADSLAAKMAGGGEDAKEAAARKKEEAKQKLKMLKLQAQLAAASGDKKAAARIAKEAAAVAKEVGNAAKDYAGQGGDVTATASTSADTVDKAAASGDAVVVSADAQNVAQQPNPATPQSAPTPDAATAVGTVQPTGDSRTAPSTNDDLQARRDAITRAGAASTGDTQFEDETRTLMDQLRAIHQQMKNLARKDGSPGTRAELERADQDMAEGDRSMAEAFGPPGGAVVAFAASTARVNITA